MISSDDSHQFYPIILKVLEKGTQDHIYTLENENMNEWMQKIHICSIASKDTPNYMHKALNEYKMKTPEQRKEAIYLAFGIFSKVLNRYDISPDLPLHTIFQQLSYKLNDLLQNQPQSHCSDQDQNCDIKEDKEEDNNIAQVRFDKYILYLVQEEFKTYIELVFSYSKKYASRVNIENYTELVRWKELCDTKETKTYRLNSHFKTYGTVPVMYKEALWPYVNDSHLTKMKFCLPFLGITYDNPKNSYIQSLMNTYSDQFKNLYVLQKQQVHDVFHTWLHDVTLPYIKTQARINYRTWYFHQILQACKNLSELCIQFKTYHPTEQTIWNFLHQGQFQNQDQDPIVELVHDKSTQQQQSPIFAQYYQEYNNSPEPDIIPEQQEQQEDNTQELDMKEDTLVSKNPYFNFNRWFNATEIQLSTQIINQIVNNNENNETSFDILFQQFQKRSKGTIFQHIDLIKTDLELTLNNLLQTCISLYCKYYWSALVMMWINRATFIMKLIQLSKQRLKENNNAHLEDRDQQELNLYDEWFLLLSNKVKELEEYHKEYVPKHIELVKELSEYMGHLCIHEKLCKKFVLWESLLHQSGALSEMYHSKWKLWEKGIFIQIKEIITQPIEDEKSKPLTPKQEQIKQNYILLHFFEDDSEIQTLYQTSYEENCHKQQICYHHNTQWNNSETYIFTNVFEDKGLSNSLFQFIHFKFDIIEMKRQLLEFMKSKQVAIDQDVSTISFDQLLYKDVPSKQLDHMYSILSSYCNTHIKNRQIILQSSLLTPSGLSSTQCSIFKLLDYFNEQYKSTTLAHLCEYITLQLWKFELLKFFIE